MKKVLTELIDGLEPLHRTPETYLAGGLEKAFAEVAEYRDGAIYIGYYSGSSEWERHSNGDEIVMVLGGSTTMVLLLDNEEVDTVLQTNELIVVPRNTWHRFKKSEHLKVLTVTPQPTDHQIERPDR